MTKRAVHARNPVMRVAALCAGLLQLVNVLHFALVPHGLNAGLNGLVHLHQRVVADSPRVWAGRLVTSEASSRPAFVACVSESADAIPDACSLGFAGSPCAAIANSALSSQIWLPELVSSVARPRVVSGRAKTLLSAPKTSPPLAA